MGLTGSKDVQPKAASNCDPYPYGDPRTALLDGAEAGDLEKITALLLRGVRRDLREKKTSGRTALMLAAGNGHLQCVDKLISCKVPLDLCTFAEGHLRRRKSFEQGYTAAMFAALYGHSECLRSLLSAGAQVDTTCTSSQKTALMIAAEEGFYECVEMLVEYGANKNAQTSDGSNAISLAAANGHSKCVEYLLSKGARPGSKGLNAAAEGGNVDCLKLLINQGLEINPKIELGVMTPLMVAAKHGHLGCVRELIAAGADIHVFSRISKVGLFHPSAMMFAAYEGHVECIEELVQAGVAVDLAPIEREHQRPIVVAVGGKQYAAVTKLVALGADMGKKSVKSVMHEALCNKDAKMVRLLCGLGVRLSKNYHAWYIKWAKGMRGGRLYPEEREIAELLRTIEREQASSRGRRSRSSCAHHSEGTNQSSSQRHIPQPSAPMGSPPRQAVQPSAPLSSSESPPPSYKASQTQYYPDLARGQASASLRKALDDQQKGRSDMS